jgi:hypothetical protein
MTEKTQAKSIEVTYGRALALLFSLALVLFCAAPSWAQTAPSAAKSSAKPAASAPAHHSNSNGGNHEGITVHGWWTIEVKNPDGKVVSHHEFENKLVTTGTNNATQLLSNLLMGSQVSGGMGVLVNFSNGTVLGMLPPALFSPGLNTGNLKSSPSAGGFTLSGQVASAQAGTISTVQTAALACGDPTSLAGFSSGLATLTPGACPYLQAGGPVLAGFDGGVASLTIIAPGTGYQVGDLLTLPLTSGVMSPLLEAAAIDSNGGVTAIDIVQAGAGWAASGPYLPVLSFIPNLGSLGSGLKVEVSTVYDPAAVGFTLTSADVSSQNIQVQAGQTVAASVAISFQ